jgi:hypothetical protein
MQGALMIGMREWINQHPKAALWAGIVVVGIAIGAVVAEVMAGRRHYPSGAPNDYFTIDDGKTFFVASSDNVAPFDYNGQQAVHANVFSCGGQVFVGYLDRYNAKYHDQVAAHGFSPEANQYGLEYKRPGDTKWVPANDLRAVVDLTSVRCPNGGIDEPQAVGP